MIETKHAAFPHRVGTGAVHRRRLRPGTACDVRDRWAEWTTTDSLAAARAARVRAHQELSLVIWQAELRYQETVEIGERFDHSLEETKRRLLR